MRERRLPKILLPLCALCLLLTLATGAAAQKQKTLYERLGGYDAIAAVVDDFLGRLTSDHQFDRFFSGHSIDSKKHIRQLFIDQICAATGGPCIYGGRTMKVSHEGLGITEADWDASAKHLVATLNKFKVKKREQDEVIALVNSLKKDIVEK